MTATNRTNDWTERYLSVVLRSIPEPKRADVDRELRSSIADDIEERVAAGDDRGTAERAVLEALGDPAQLASAYIGRPNYLLGPELFPLFRHLLPRLLTFAVPLAALAMAVAKFASGGSYADAIGAGISGAITVAIQLAFWTTLAFIFLERAEAARDARSEIVAKTGRWTVERLPDQAPGRVSASEAIGEVLTSLITIGGLLFLRSISVPGPAGSEVPLFDPALTNFWYPVFIGVLLAQAVLQVIVFAVGRWTMPLAIAFTPLQLGFALPIILLAINGTLINPAFAAEVGYPALAEGDKPVMLVVAVGTTLASAWEIISAFVRARGGRPLGTYVQELRRSI